VAVCWSAAGGLARAGGGHRVEAARRCRVAGGVSQPGSCRPTAPQQEQLRCRRVLALLLRVWLQRRETPRATEMDDVLQKRTRSSAAHLDVPSRLHHVNMSSALSHACASAPPAWAAATAAAVRSKVCSTSFTTATHVAASNSGVAPPLLPPTATSVPRWRRSSR
jgi:hypothetical protein